MSINDLGYSDFFSDKVSVNEDTFSIGRIVKVHKESYDISDGKSEYFGKLTGNMIYSSVHPEDFPIVGDFVLFQNFESDSLALIHKIIERRTLLKRKSAGKKVEYQPIAANVDFGIIMQGLDNDFNINRLERYLVMLEQFKVTPIILFSKSDLIAAEELISIKNNLAERFQNIEVIFFSNFEKESIMEIVSFLIPGKTFCLIGSSGVGKSTLINNLIGEEVSNTQEVRENDSKGRHTTTNRQLFLLKNGAMIIDNPGMRELANISVTNGIEGTFDEISELSENCKFSDCTHTVEKGCAVLEALENGDIESKRYENFIKLRKESEYYERSYVEKRKRDKEFGKMVKSILKHKKKK